MKHYFLNERTENGVETLNHYNSIEEAEFALNGLETATEVDTFEEEEETVEMEVYANTGDYYISTRPSDSYKEAHAEEFAAEKEAEKAAKAEAIAKAKAEAKALAKTDEVPVVDNPEELCDFSLTDENDDCECTDEVEDEL